MSIEVSKELYIKLKYEAMLLGNLSMEQLYKIAPQLFYEEKKNETKVEPPKPEPISRPESTTETKREQEPNEYDDEQFHSFY